MYLPRNIAVTRNRERALDLDRMMYTTARQDDHVQQGFVALEFMDRGDLCRKLEHVLLGPKIRA